MKTKLIGLLVALLLPIVALSQQPATPSQLSLFSAAGSTIRVEIRNAIGVVVPLVDAAGAKWPYATVVIPAGQAEGLGWAIKQVQPDGTNNLNGLNASAWTAVIRVVSGTVNMSTSGTLDGSAGAGYGLIFGLPAPDANTPTTLSPNVTYQIGPGGTVAMAAPGSSANVFLQDYNPYRATTKDLTGNGTTILVSFEDANGAPLPMTDTASVSYDSVSISIPASTTWGLSWAILNQVKPDGTHLIASLPTGAVSIRITVTGTTSTSPALSLNFGGTVDGSAGTGSTGFATGYGASANTPTQLYVGEQRVFGKVRG